ncbi:MAG: CHAT domain-containing protein [bacterium]|nr:CHAT domain-containing protein [bacterium]
MLTRYRMTRGGIVVDASAKIRVNTESIAISACNIGRGEQVHGEGVMGLARAFMYAGTPAISITLWSVESQSTKLLTSCR